MAVQVSFPGVYIEEFTPGAPIQGVSTSVAALLGPATSGPLNAPMKVTSWDQFKSTFGGPLPGFYLWFAVRGFFENGGQTCFVSRVSNAAHDQLVLNDQSAQPAIRLRARTAGVSVPAISVVVDDTVQVLTTAAAHLFRPQATVTTASGTTITVTNAADALNFRPGDPVTISGTTVSAIVSRVEGAVVRLVAPIAGVISAGTLHLADLATGATEFRLESPVAPDGGTVIELSQGPGPTTQQATVRSVIAERITPALTTYRVSLEQGLTSAVDLDPAAAAVTVESFEFQITVTQGGPALAYDLLSMNPGHPRYFRAIINSDETSPVDADPVEPPNITIPPGNRPAALVATNLSGGTADSPATLGASNYLDALALLEPVRSLNMVSIPDRTDAAVQAQVVAHCEQFQRFAILSSQRGAPLFGPGSVESQGASVQSQGGYAALYYPWLYVLPERGDLPVLVPPVGHLAGIYARTDVTRGVFKAPAGEEATVNGAIAIERDMSDNEQGLLNLGQGAGIAGINVVRVFRPGGRPIVWGARTTATDRSWQYVNVRRLFLFLEGSIEEGIRWAVFEPNNLQLWQKLKRTISEFLTRVWRDGGLFGAKAEDAFYVRIDEALNPFSEQALGRLNIEIGIRPTYPAEFIIVRIGIWPGGSEVTEG